MRPVYCPDVWVTRWHSCHLQLCFQQIWAFLARRENITSNCNKQQPALTTLQTITFYYINANAWLEAALEHHNSKIPTKLFFRLFAGSRTDEPSLRETWRSWRRMLRRRPRFLWEEPRAFPVFRGRTSQCLQPSVSITTPTFPILCCVWPPTSSQSPWHPQSDHQ